MLRIFVGLSLPYAIRDRLSMVCRGLPGARWVDPDSMHITLRFIGEIDGAAAEDLDHALSRITAPSFAVTIGGIGFFDNGGKVHTLLAAVDREAALVHLRDKIESAVVRCGHIPERRKFKPHVTLARLKHVPPDRIGAFLEHYGRLTMQPFTVDTFTLFRSHLRREGSIYESLADYSLSTPWADMRPWAEDPAITDW